MQSAFDNCGLPLLFFKWIEITLKWFAQLHIIFAKNHNITWQVLQLIAKSLKAYK